MIRVVLDYFGAKVSCPIETHVYDPATRQFKALWQRGGRAATATHTLRSSSQVLLNANLHTIPVQIEDDANGNVYYDAKIVDLCVDTPGQVRIRYDAWGGKEEMVDVSQVSFGCRGRKRRASAAAAKAESPLKKKAGRRGGAKAAKLARTSNDKPPSKQGSRVREEEIVLLDASSASSGEEEERPLSKKKNGNGASPVQPRREASTTPAPRRGWNGDGWEGGRNDDDDDDDGDEEEPEERRREDLSAAPLSDDREGYGSDEDDDVENKDVNEAVNEFLAAQGSRLFPGESLRASNRSAAPNRSAGGEDNEDSTGSHFSEESDSAASSEEEGVAGQTSSDEGERVRSKRKRSRRKSAVSSCSGSSANEEEEAEPVESDGGGTKKQPQPRKRAASYGSDSSANVEDEAGPENAAGRGGRRRAHRRRVAAQKGTAGRSSSSSSEDEDANAKRRTSRKRTTSGSTASRTSSEGADEGATATRVPRRKSQRSSVSPSEDDEDMPSRRDAGIVMHGFCRSVSQMKNPYRTIEMVQNMLEKAGSGECGKDTEEFKETIIDANMLLQETLYNLNERTTFIKAPSDNAERSNGPKSPSDGNKGIIVRLARRFGLTSEDVDELFTRLEMSNGYYSIDDAIPKIMWMKSVDEPLEDDSGDERGANLAVGDGTKGKRSFNLLGSRVKTVLEDGREYEGTISTVHYRVMYDDGDTETFINEAEAFQNLACNDNTSCPEGLSCSMLEIFSGCSLLSTLCKRKGMNAISIDNDIADSNATVKADFTSDYVQSLLATNVFDYIHASPVCSTYSTLAGGKHRDKENYNKTPASHESDAMLMLLYFYLSRALKANKDATVTIENPRGWMRHGSIMKELFEGELGFKRFEINYCQFGRADMKPTNIWTNDMKLGNILESIGGKCNCELPHAEGVKKRSSSGPKNFAALPMKLCELLSTYVHSKHTQLKLEKLVSNRPDGTEAG